MRRIADSTILARIKLGYRLYGIDYVSRTISWLPRHLVGPTLKKYGASIGKGVVFKDHLLIDNAGNGEDTTGNFSHLIIGSSCYIGKSVLFDLPAEIILEEEVVLSAGVNILTHADCGARMMSQWFPRRTGSVRLGKGTWVGVGAVILPGVSIGPCSVVGARAMVNKDFPGYCVLAGVPAKIVHHLEASKI